VQAVHSFRHCILAWNPSVLLLFGLNIFFTNIRRCTGMGEHTSENIIYFLNLTQVFLYILSKFNNILFMFNFLYLFNIYEVISQ